MLVIILPVMVMMTAFTLLFLVIMMAVMMFVFLAELLHLCTKAVFTHGGKNLFPIQLRPWGRDEPRFGIHALQQFRRFQDFLLPRRVRPAHDDQICMSNLI